MQESSDQKTDSNLKDWMNPEENPFLWVKETISEVIDPLNSVIFGNPKDRHDLGLLSDVKENTRFREASERFRKWFIGIAIVFVITTIANLAYMVLNSFR